MAIYFDDQMTAGFAWRHLVCFYLLSEHIEAKIRASNIRGFDALGEDDKKRVKDRIIQLIDKKIE